MGVDLAWPGLAPMDPTLLSLQLASHATASPISVVEAVAA
jgi:hypothetical protein